jgi:hypothetical protein
MHSGAAAAAAEQQRQMRREEEEMTPYTADDLAQDWEFKILRSATGAFRLPKRLQRALEEESCAGWVFVEKFDDTRIRLKRPAKARERDGNLTFDPYRTYVGASPNAIALMIVGAVLAAIAVIVGGILLAKR